jgi:lysophospholipase L1-like esterase
MAKIQRIASLGDSVPWGQGLLENDKYDVFLATKFGATLHRTAHSGATIGATLIEGGPADGEVPVALPTIHDQCVNFADSPETIDLVLLNGGLNDVDFRTILNPLVPAPILSALTHKFCHDAMLGLLQTVAARFSNPAARIIVTGYYPIISDQSDPPCVLGFLGIHGIAPPPFVEKNFVIEAVIDRCRQFFQESTADLRRAVADAGDARIAYVDAGFTDANSVFAPKALLWGLAVDLDLSPVDEVADQRHKSCDAAFNEFQVLEREQCYRASAGHPNVDGARQFANQILAALNTA